MKLVSTKTKNPPLPHKPKNGWAKMAAHYTREWTPKGKQPLPPDSEEQARAQFPFWF